MKDWMIRHKLVWIFAIAFSARLGGLLFFGSQIRSMEEQQMGDSVEYKAVASHWTRGYRHVLDPNAAYPTGSNRAPLYPLLLSLTIRSGDQDWTTGRLQGCLLGSAIVLACVLLGRACLRGGPTPAWIAGWICAFYPFLVLYSLLLLTETLFTLFLVCSLWLWCKAREEGRGKHVLLLGWALALATLTRPIVLFFPIWVGLDLFLIRKKWNHVFLLVFSFLILLTPHLLLLRLQYGRWIPITTEGGKSFYQGNNPMNKSGGAIHGTDYLYPDWVEGMDEVASSRALLKEGARYVLDHPILFLYRGIRKVGRLYAIHPGAGSGFDRPWMAWCNALIVLPLYLLATLGAIMSWKERSRQLPLYALVLYTTFFCLLFTGSQRFSLPLVPCFAIWAAIPLRLLGARFREIRTQIP